MGGGCGAGPVATIKKKKSFMEGLERKIDSVVVRQQWVRGGLSSDWQLLGKRSNWLNSIFREMKCVNGKEDPGSRVVAR